MAEDLKVKLVLTAKDNLTSVIKRAITASDKEFAKLQDRLSDTADKFDEYGRKIRNLGLGISAVGLGIAHSFKLTSAVGDSIKLEHQLREIGNVGGLTTEQLKGLDKQISEISKKTNNFNSEIAEGLGSMVAGGFDPTEAIKYMNSMSKAKTATGAEINDLAKMSIALSDNLKISSNEMLKVYDMTAHAGKEGRFELAAMARYFPEITASAGTLGMKGQKSVAQIASAMQIAMKGAGTEGEAATNVSAFLGGLSQTFVVDRFKKEFGVTIASIRDNAIAQGTDPILAIIDVVRKKTGGNADKIARVFRDKSMADFVKIMTLNLDEYREMTGRVAQANGVIEQDFNNMMQTTSEQWKRLTINMGDKAKTALETPLLAVNRALKLVNDNPILQKGLFSMIVGTIGVGTALTALSAIPFMAGSITRGFSDALNMYRELDVFIWAKAPQLQQPIKFTLGGAIQGLKNGFVNLKDGIVNSSKAMFDFIKSTPKNIYTGIKDSINGITNAFKSFRKGVFLADLQAKIFNTTLYLNPMTWIAAAIAGGAFLIYKYWKPITAFFKGTFQGLKEGLQPLQPLFNKIGQALKPLGDWVKGIFKPVEDNGNKALNWGKQFGLWLAKCINWCVDLASKIKNVLTLGGRIKLGGKSLVVDAGGEAKTDGSHFNGLSSVPFDGYRANLHKDEAVLTAKEAKQWRSFKTGNANTISLNYSPVINMPNNINESTKSAFVEELRKHKTELYSMVKDMMRREERRAYA